MTLPHAATADHGGATDMLLGQSLAKGAAGMALLHIERAHAGTQTWQTAHASIKAATSGPIIAAYHAGLYYGAPAISFILHAAQTDGTPRYRSATATIDAHVTQLTERRLEAAHARIDRGETTTFAEYDLFYGLTGIGALLLRHTPDAEILPRILGYLVRLTHSLEGGLPGWWVSHDPDPILPTPGGHANLGMAHGVGGILALMSSAMRQGVVVDGQAEAIDRICRWLDHWQQDGQTGPWWPQWITREERRTGRPAQNGPGQPSWCYGTVGIARAQQLAAIATDDPVRRMAAEEALAACLSDRQLHRITEAGLCHGMAGVYQTAYRAARDAHNPAIGQRLPALAAALIRHAAAAQNDKDDATGLLTGDAGVSLALETTRHTTPPRSGWDACLLIT